MASKGLRSDPFAALGIWARATPRYSQMWLRPTLSIV